MSNLIDDNLASLISSVNPSFGGKTCWISWIPFPGIIESPNSTVM